MFIKLPVQIRLTSSLGMKNRYEKRILLYFFVSLPNKKRKEKKRKERHSHPSDVSLSVTLL